MQQKHFLEPAASVVEMFGGCRATAEMLDLNAGTVSRWMTPSSERGTGGTIPQRHWPLILKMAKLRRVKLTIKKLSGMC